MLSTQSEHLIHQMDIAKTDTEKLRAHDEAIRADIICTMHSAERIKSIQKDVAEIKNTVCTKKAYDDGLREGMRRSIDVVKTLIKLGTIGATSGGVVVGILKFSELITMGG